MSKGNIPRISNFTSLTNYKLRAIPHAVSLLWRSGSHCCRQADEHDGVHCDGRYLHAYSLPNALLNSILP